MTDPALEPGLHDELVDEELASALDALEDEALATLRQLEADQLTRHAPLHLARALQRALASKEDLADQLALCNDLLEVLQAHRIAPPPRLLEAVELAPAERPLLAPGANGLLANDGRHPALDEVLRHELPSAEHVDLICAFIKWEGLRLIRPALQAHLARGRPVRVLTTTYMGVTEPRAVEELEAMGAHVRVCYETQTTRLHAKAWLFERPRECSSALIGSSNLSGSALTDGMEWNVRLSQRLAPRVLERFRRLFESYWRASLFEPYDQARFVAAARAFDGARPSGPGAAPPPEPYPHQHEILEALRRERDVHGRRHNLVVAATGTGKTLVAAFDFREHLRRAPSTTLLFVAHRQDILEQSLEAFRWVLGDDAFGELYVGGHRPERGEHVFASIQSLSSGQGPAALGPGAFDVVVIDEFHHAAAPTYDALLEHLKPKYLLGLTATPERADDEPVLGWFDGHIAAELRLWDALDRQLLAPFHYFGIDDQTDLSQVSWRRGGYDTGELEQLYTADDIRVRLILRQLCQIVTDPARMRALGFCVSIKHAEFMAEAFCEAGFQALALTSRSTDEERAQAPGRLERGELQIIFTVDLYNEGVDIPCVDTLLMLRPTESATIFLQQLGRGLRHAPGKACLTVLDFIGAAHRKFRFGERYRALTGSSRAELREGLDGGGLYLPPGCALELDEISTERVLDSVRDALSLRQTARELGATGDVPMGEFLEEVGLEVDELYQTKSWSWTKLRQRAGHIDAEAYRAAFDESIGQRIRRLTHIDDPERLRLYLELLGPGEPDPGSLTQGQVRQVAMLYNRLWGPKTPSGGHAESPAQALATLRAHELVRAELRELFEVLAAHAHARPDVHPLCDLIEGWPEAIPLSAHATYTRQELFAAFGEVGFGEYKSHREGVWYHEPTGADVFLITLDKSADHYTPGVMYEDYPIDERRFHWESQNSTGPDTPVGQRYIDPNRSGPVLLFVRPRDKEGGDTLPYRLLGPAHHVEHAGARPMSITWELEVPIPRRFLRRAQRAAGLG